MIDMLVQRVVSNVGIDNALAQKAIAIVLGFLVKKGPSDSVGQLMNAMPGASDLVSQFGGGEEDAGGSGGGIMGKVSGMMGGLMGGGEAMKLLGQLQGAGLDASQAKGVGSEVIGFAKEQAGEDVVKQIAAGIPGLDKFL